MQKKILFLAYSYILCSLTGGCLPLLPEREKEIHWEDWPPAVKSRLQAITPVTCNSHSVYVSPNPNLPYEVAHQLLVAGQDSPCAELSDRILGTDLGISVHFGVGDRDIIYFGDTLIPERRDFKHGPEFYLRHNCAYKPHFLCDDAYGFTSDDDPSDGIDLAVQGTEWAHLNRRDKIAGWVRGFDSIRLLGINAPDETGDLKSDEEGDDLFGEFNAPSGAMPIQAYVDPTTSQFLFFEYGRKNFGSSQDLYKTQNGVLMFFATANNVYDKKKNWLGCSSDLVTFRSCAYPRESEVTLFSQDKFIHISPVPFSTQQIEDVCVLEPASILCNLRAHLTTSEAESRPGALLFGNGKHYRCSPLYLAYLELSTGSVWYYSAASRDGWSDAESQATAVIAPNTPDYNPDDRNTCPYYSDTPSDERSTSLFGEVSVKLFENRLIMLSNHFQEAGGDTFVRVYYRTAPLAEPQSWTEPQATEAVGYGPFILDRYTSVSGSRLIVYHLLSTWNPSFSPEEPYSVVSTQLTLQDTGKPPIWED